MSLVKKRVRITRVSGRNVKFEVLDSYEMMSDLEVTIATKDMILIDTAIAMIGRICNITVANGKIQHRGDKTLIDYIIYSLVVFFAFFSGYQAGYYKAVQTQTTQEVEYTRTMLDEYKIELQKIIEALEK